MSLKNLSFLYRLIHISTYITFKGWQKQGKSTILCENIWILDNMQFNCEILSFSKDTGIRIDMYLISPHYCM